MKFRIWAPYAEKIELVTLGQKTAMSRDSKGWWSCEAACTEKEVEYGYLIDGEGPYPDPRSAFQPKGVHELSRVVDHENFRWSDEGWQMRPLSNAIIYELHVGTFTDEGTFEAVIEKLGHLKELGVTHLELMPVVEFSGGRGWGYDGVYFYAPHHAYGGPMGLKKLVDGCHREGLSVIADVVYNHFGPEGNYAGKFGPYTTEKYKTAWGKAINFDGEYSDEVRDFIVANALMWLRDYHFDGLRLDAVHAIFDQSAVNIMEQIGVEVGKLKAETGREYFVIAESDLNNPRLVQSRDIGGYGLSAQWNDDFHHAVHAFLSGEEKGYYLDFGRLADLAKSLTSVFVYDGKYSRFRKRRHGRKVQNCGGGQFVSCVQNHDQVGNRAKGERLNHIVTFRKAKLAAAVLMMSPFVPLIFQGQEWAASSPFQYFTSHEDGDLGKAVSEGRKEEFASFELGKEDVPDPQDERTFLRSKLKWAEVEEGKHAEMLGWYKQLIALRNGKAEIRNCDLERVRVYFDEDKKWLKLWRGNVLCIFNFNVMEQVIGFAGDVREVLIKSDEKVKAGSHSVEMPETSVVVLELESLERD